MNARALLNRIAASAKDLQHKRYFDDDGKELYPSESDILPTPKMYEAIARVADAVGEEISADLAADRKNNSYYQPQPFYTFKKIDRQTHDVVTLSIDGAWVDPKTSEKHHLLLHWREAQAVGNALNEFSTSKVEVVEARGSQ